MVRNMIKTLRKGILIVFAVLALTLFIETPASVLAADQGWHDPQGWFRSGGNLPNESDWYSATYGGRLTGQPYAYHKNQTSYWDQSEPRNLSELQEEQPYAPPATPDYYGNFPTQPGFAKLNPSEYPSDQTYTYYDDSRYYYQDQSYRNQERPGSMTNLYREERPGSMTNLDREEPYAPPATPNYYGNYPTQPGFSKMEYSEDHGFQEREWAIEDPSKPRGIDELSRAPATPNYYGTFPTQPGFAKLRPEVSETSYGYYEESMRNEPRYYTRDWGSRGEFETWY